MGGDVTLQGEVGAINCALVDHRVGQGGEDQRPAIALLHLEPLEAVLTGGRRDGDLAQGAEIGGSGGLDLLTQQVIGEGLAVLAVGVVECVDVGVEGRLGGGDQSRGIGSHLLGTLGRLLGQNRNVLLL